MSIVFANDVVQTLRTMLAQSLLSRVYLSAVSLYNAAQSRRHNIQMHYDGDSDLYEAMLGRTWQYTCPYLPPAYPYEVDSENALDDMQTAKMQRVCDKIDLHRGDHVLDLGCGWGTLLRHMFQHYEGTITGVGVTLATEQVRVGRKLLAEIGISETDERAKIRLVEQDIFDYLPTVPDHSFDKIVSIGMMEHIQYGDYDKLIRELNRVIRPHGKILIHAISNVRNTETHDPFVQKYLFPNSTQMNVPRLMATLHDYDLLVVDMQEMGQHYFYALEQWYTRVRRYFASERAQGRYSDAYQRLWFFYLQQGMALTRYGAFYLNQLVVVKNQRSHHPFRPLYRV